MQPTDDIIKLTPYRHVRLRTEMYYGSRAPHYQTVINWTGNKLEPLEVTWTPAVYTFLREVIDNSLDEVIAHGYGDTIDITYNSKTFEFSVADNGRGIPIDWDENEKMHKATLVLSQIMAGRNFDSRGESAGLNGIGASGVNFCSEYFNVIIQRDNKRFEQMFHEGTEMFDELDIREPVITKGGNKSGTYIKFKLSKTVFKNPKLPIEFVKARIFEIAASYPKIKFNFNGQLLKVKPTVEKTLFANNDVIIIDINNPNFKSKYYIVPNFANEGEYVHTLVNRIPAFNGGQHIDTFKKLFYSGLLSSLERESKKRGLQPNKSDISEGLLIYNITTMLNPNFDSQSKTRLINDEVDVYIKDVLNNENTFKNIIKHNKEWIDSIYKRCSDRTQRKDEVEIAKLSRKLMRTKVPKLLDANGKDRTKCIIFICEGDCLGEDTEIAIFENGKFINKKIKDVEINDLVMTHTGSIKPIEYKQAKIVDGLQITTSTNKKVIVGYEHKLLVFNKNTQKYDFIKAKYIDKTIHYLIKSLININAGFIEIISISDSNVIKFNKVINFIINGEIQSVLMSNHSKCAVFDMKLEKVCMKDINDINPTFDLLLANNIKY